jgi:hypothetical protein
MSEPTARGSIRYEQPGIVRRDTIEALLEPVQSDGPPKPDN